MVKHSIDPGLRSIEYEAAAGSIHSSSIVPTINLNRGTAVIVLVMVKRSLIELKLFIVIT
jgi:hypothetical protein